MFRSFLVYKKRCYLSRLSRIYPFSKITNSNIDDYTYVNIFASVNNTDIGKFCSISMNFKSGMGMHPINFVSTSPFFYSKKNALNRSVATRNTFNEYKRVSIGNDVWIGADVIILDGVKVGNGAIVAAKSVVSKDVPDYAVVGGVPAKIIKYRFSKEDIVVLKNLKWWDFDIKILKENVNLFNRNINLKTLKHLVKVKEIISK